MAQDATGGILEALFRLAAGVLSIIAFTGGYEPSTDGPPAEDGEYALPGGDAIVIRIAENNGSVAPEYQTGYAVEIHADGYAEYIFTPEGAGDSLVTVAELGHAGVQDLLQRLNAIGIFDLANPDDEPPPGASIDLLEISLEDGTWLIQNVDLDRDAATRLDLAQALIVATVQSAA